MGHFIYLAIGVITLCCTAGNSEYIGGSSCLPNKEQDLETDDIKVNFYDFETPINMTARINIAAFGLTLDNNRLDPNKKLIVFIPKYQPENTYEQFLRTFRNVENVYIITIDYTAYTGDLDEENFISAVQNSYAIGQKIGIFLADLYYDGFPAENITLVGHGFGGQIVGFSGEKFIEQTADTIGKIVSIDPAGPCFDRLGDHVRSGQAKYVEIYHCNLGGIGSKIFLGDIDFILNYGREQPGCVKDFKGHEKKCRMNSCLSDWLWTVRRPRMFMGCSNVDGYKNSDCNEKHGFKAIAGYHNKGYAKGIFYVSTFH